MTPDGLGYLVTVVAFLDLNMGVMDRTLFWTLECWLMLIFIISIFCSLLSSESLTIPVSWMESVLYHVPCKILPAAGPTLLILPGPTQVGSCSLIQPCCLSSSGKENDEPFHFLFPIQKWRNLTSLPSSMVPLPFSTTASLKWLTTLLEHTSKFENFPGNCMREDLKAIFGCGFNLYLIVSPFPAYHLFPIS